MNRAYLQNSLLGLTGLLLGALSTLAGFLISKIQGVWWMLAVIVPLLALTGAALWLQWRLAESRELVGLEPVDGGLGESVKAERPASTMVIGASGSAPSVARMERDDSAPAASRPEAPVIAAEPRTSESPPAEVALGPPFPAAPPFAESVEVEGLLSEVWETYFLHGDGRLTPEGLERRLREARVEARVLPGEEAGVMEGLFLVFPRNAGDKVYLVPDFNKTIRSVSEWFAAPRADSRLARIQRVVRPAAGRTTREGLEKTLQGIVE